MSLPGFESFCLKGLPYLYKATKHFASMAIKSPTDSLAISFLSFRRAAHTDVFGNFKGSWRMKIASICHSNNIAFGDYNVLHYSRLPSFHRAIGDFFCFIYYSLC